MEDIFSILLYFFFFFGCIYLDKHQNKKQQIKVFIFLLFIFLCFGYMTGSDWRIYELRYEDADYYFKYSVTDIGFFSTFYILKVLFGDFFIVNGILKCLYLLSLIYLFKKISEHWIAVLGLNFAIGSLLFMTIDCPLRFMTANIFINFSLIYLLKNDLKRFILLALPSVFFHLTSVIVIALLLVLKINWRFERIHKGLLYLSYLIISLLFSSLDRIMSVFSLVSTMMILASGNEEGGYKNYGAVDNESFFTVGSFLMMIMAGVIIYYRDYILSTNNGKYIFNGAFLFLTLSRITLIIPTGFRLVIPLGFFYFTALVLILYKSRFLVRTVLTLMFASMLYKSLYFTFTYIPYSNSIYYILMGHKSYNERSDYNPNAYTQRTGKQLENQENE